MKNENFISASLKLNKKQSPLDKRFSAISLTCAFVCVFAWLAFIAVIVFNFNLGLAYFSISIYFIGTATAIGLYFSIKQLLRNLYFDSLLSFVILISSLVAIFVTVLVEFIVLQNIYIFPVMPV